MLGLGHLAVVGQEGCANTLSPFCAVSGTSGVPVD